MLNFKEGLIKSLSRKPDIVIFGELNNKNLDFEKIIKTDFIIKSK